MTKTMAVPHTRTHARRRETGLQRFVRVAKRTGRRFLQRHLVKLILIGLPLLGLAVGLFVGIKVTSYTQSVKLNDYGRMVSYKQYTVREGDTVWGIASDLAALNPEYNDIRQYVNAIKKANELYSDHIEVGQVIFIPYYISPNKMDYNEIYDKYGLNQ